MRKAKLTSTNLLDINTIMLNTIADYINTFAKDADSVSSLQMYADDVAHNVTALQNFNTTHDAQQLHNAIMLQDTLVREYFYTTLKYIEVNNLISKENFCCIV